MLKNLVEGRGEGFELNMLGYHDGEWTRRTASIYGRILSKGAESNLKSDLNVLGHHDAPLGARKSVPRGLGQKSLAINTYHVPSVFHQTNNTTLSHPTHKVTITDANFQQPRHLSSQLLITYFTHTPSSLPSFATNPQRCLSSRTPSTPSSRKTSHLLSTSCRRRYAT